MGLKLTFDESEQRPPARSGTRGLFQIAQVLIALLIGLVIGDNLLSGGRWSNLLINDAGVAIETLVLLGD